jgi:hypothetical protein
MNALIIALLLIGSDPTGRIRGHVHFPACMPPADLQVCAERSDGFSRCTTKLMLTEVGLAYTLEVPPGRYLVYARSESTLAGYRAYFSKAVHCGLRVGCDDHAPVPVNVRANKTVSGVDPDDWFAPIYERPLEPSA